MAHRVDHHHKHGRPPRAQGHGHAHAHPAFAHAHHATKKDGRTVTFATPPRPLPELPPGLEHATPDPPGDDPSEQLDYVYGLCNVLVDQLTQVTNAYESERDRRVRAEEERNKLQLDKVKFFEACQKAGRQIEEDRDFIRVALRHAMEQELLVTSLREQLAASRARGALADVAAHADPADPALDALQPPLLTATAPPPTTTSSDAIARLAHIEQMSAFLKENPAVPLPAP